MGKRGPLPDDAMTRWLKGQGPRPAGARPAGGGDGRQASRTPRAPGYLGPEGSKLWRRLYPELEAAGLLAASDLPLLELVCASWDSWVAARKATLENGVLLPDGRGALRKSPSLQVERDSAATIMRAFGALGIGPAAAARLGLELDDGS